jgi:TrmH family RNA methyltransferase
MKTITSLQNPQVKRLVRLRRRREREAEGAILLEEPLVIARALAAGHPLREVYVCPDLVGDAAADLLAELEEGGRDRWRVTALSPAVMAKVSYGERTTGIVVVADRLHHELEALALPDAPLCVVLDTVEKPGNLGAVLRAADGAGADAVLVSGGGTDLGNPNVLRASRGACFSVPAVEADPGRIRDFLRARGIALVATAPSAELVYTACDLTGPVAIACGAEDRGLDGAWLAAADRLVRIPMRGAADSLNVATAAALLLYEAVRQRSALPA